MNQKTILLVITILITFSCFLEDSSLNAQELSLHQGFWSMKFYEDNNQISKKEFEGKMNSHLAITILITSSCFLEDTSLNAQELSVHQGFWSMKFYEDNNQISKKEFEGKMNSHPEAGKLWSSYKSNNVGASILAFELGNFGFQEFKKFSPLRFALLASKVPFDIDGVKYTFHHHQDGKSMMLVPSSVNNPAAGGASHIGGNAIMKKTDESPFKDFGPKSDKDYFSKCN